MIKEHYLKCLAELENNPNIEFTDDKPKKELADFSGNMLEYIVEDIQDMGGITLNDNDLDYLKFASVSFGWRSLLEKPGLVLKGGFVFNGISDALLFPTDYFDNAKSINPNEDFTEKLRWFDRLPIGVDDSMRGCFIKEEGNFPPPIAFCNAGADWYTKLDFDYYKYMELLFQNYGFKGWQYFYINITKEIPRLDKIIEDMKNAVETMPLLFPDKDWSYHQQRYEEVL